MKTDEQIEKALSICGTTPECDFRNCPYGADMSCRRTHNLDTLDYLKRIKADRDYWKSETEIARKGIGEAAKETAKNIYKAVTPLLIMKNKKYGDDAMTITANEWFEKKVKEIFEPFGVEVDK